MVHTFNVSRDQWAAFTERTKAHKVSGTLRSAWGKAWCVDNEVQPTDEGMMEALDAGLMSWKATVVQCVGYDAKLLQQLLRG